MKVFMKVFASIGLIMVAVVVSALIMTVPVYLLWNWFMPEIFGLATLDFWQAMGVSMLAGCLFGRSSSSSSK